MTNTSPPGDLRLLNLYMLLHPPTKEQLDHQAAIRRWVFWDRVRSISCEIAGWLVCGILVLVALFAAVRFASGQGILTKPKADKPVAAVKTSAVLPVNVSKSGPLVLEADPPKNLELEIEQPRFRWPTRISPWHVYPSSWPVPRTVWK
jgi:hypothetical protein